MDPMAPEDKNMRDTLNEIINRKIDTNRRYIDEVLQKVLEHHKRYYFEKFLDEVNRMELEEKVGNLQGAFQHKVMADTYKGILEKAFGVTDSA